MRLSGIKRGDLIRLHGDPSIWVVRAKERGRIECAIASQQRSWRWFKAGEVAEHWAKRVGR